MSSPRYPALTDPSPDALERRMLAQWKAEALFRKTQAQTAQGPPFVFYEGPPTANGRPGIHHIFARTVKDLVCRYQVMQGHQITRIAGWDTHGLPVEIEVEKKLGITGKTEIGDHPGAKVSVAEFNRLSRESVWQYKSDWETLSDRIAYWLDYDHPYITYSNNYVESVWWLLSELYRKQLLIRGHKVLPYCPRCGTALSSHELAQGYDTAKDPSVYVLFPLEPGNVGTWERGNEEAYLLVWTTTPWTLASNFAVAVHPDLDYVVTEWRGKRVIVAESRADKIVPGGDTVPLSRVPTFPRIKGAELVGLKYQRPLDIVPWPEGRRWEVVAGDFVTAEDGSGMVHMAPFGADDFKVLKDGNFAYTVPVDGAGKFKGTTWPEIEGVFVKDADQRIMEKLKADGLLLKRETIEHTYPFCWRCDTPLLYYPRPSWFVKTTAFKERMVELNAQVDWHPPEIGAGRFGEWLENNVDWALSRDRFWGTPLPVWICDQDADHLDVVGSYEQLAQHWGKPLPADFDPHKPHIDGYTWKCRSCAGTMKRAGEVIDTWFDSGAMPVGQWHYPFEHQDEFKAHFPADYICEAVDQTRGWFYSLLAIATGVFDRPAYKHVIVCEMMLDAKGQKMSKSRGNVVDPLWACATFGADAVRLYFLLSSQVWLPKRWDEAQVRDVAGTVLEKLRQTYNLFRLYAGDWKPAGSGPLAVGSLPLGDRWLLDRLRDTVRAVRAAWDGYDVSTGTRAIVQFVVDDLSNWWVRLNRSRFWVPGGSADPVALATLHEALVVTSQLLAPAAPFLSDALHRALTGTSVHLATFPAAGTAADAKLARAMDVVRRLASLARSAREEAKLKVRQPLSRLIAAIPADVDPGLFAALVPLLESEVNVKAVELAQRGTDLVLLEPDPNFRALGKRFGNQTKDAAAAIRQLQSADVAKFEAGERVEIVVQGVAYALEPEEMKVKRQARGALLVQTDGEVVAALDPALTSELKQEGLAREIVSRVQRMRRDAGLEVTDRIRISLDGDAPVKEAAHVHRGYISEETLAVELALETAGAGAAELDLDGLSATIGITKAD
ncbi:MAG TPA: isoleucine--tRNA ligase [Gemmatimonadales bacterium]